MVAPAADLASFTHDRLRRFIHFGLCALAGRHEWVQNYERIDSETYARYFDHFDPELFDAAGWARLPQIYINKGAEDWGSVELMAMTGELQPEIVINDRLDIPGDLVTPEQYQPSEPMRVNGASEIAFAETDADADAQNTSMGGQPAGTLTLILPIRRPAAAVPVVKLFLK